MYRYEKIQKKNYKRKPRKAPEESRMDVLTDIVESTESKQLSKRTDSINRTRSNIRRTIQANPDLTKFVTLTFADNITDISLANKLFNKFIMRLNYIYDNFKYICIIEFQKRGAVHYHFLCNMPYIENTKLNKIWKNGFVKINKIKHVDNVAVYVCKYLQKDMRDERMLHKKKFFRSKNLEQPLLVYDDCIIDKLIAQYDLNSTEPSYEATFFNEYTGTGTYKTYTIHDSPA